MNSVQLNDILELVDSLIDAERTLESTDGCYLDEFEKAKNDSKIARIKLESYLEDLIQ